MQQDRLWLATVLVHLVESEEQGPEETRTYLLVAPDAIEAEHKLFRYPGLNGADIQELIKLADDVALVWGPDGQPWEGTAAAD